jgi:hypothetical protein
MVASEGPPVISFLCLAVEVCLAFLFLVGVCRSGKKIARRSRKKEDLKARKLLKIKSVKNKVRSYPKIQPKNQS